MVSIQIEELPHIIREDVEDFLETHPRSSAAQLRDALEDFNLRFMEPLISRNGSERD